MCLTFGEGGGPSGKWDMSHFWPDFFFTMAPYQSCWNYTCCHNFETKHLGTSQGSIKRTSVRAPLGGSCPSLWGNLGWLGKLRKSCKFAEEILPVWWGKKLDKWNNFPGLLKIWQKGELMRSFGTPKVGCFFCMIRIASFSLFMRKVTNCIWGN